MQLVVDHSVGGKAAQIVAGVVGFESELAVKASASNDGLRFVTPEVTTTQASAILRDLCRRKKRADLLGTTPLEQARVDEWLFAVTTKLGSPTPESFAVVQRLTSQLLTTSFSAGDSLTLADLALYPALWGHVSVLKDAPASARSNLAGLLRWFNTLQLNPDVQRAVAAGAVNLPLLDLKIPPSGIFKAKFEVAQKPKEATEKGDKKEKEGDKKEKKEKKAEKADKPDKSAKGNPPKKSLSFRMDCRVGKVLTVENHPTEPRLYVCTIECGVEGGPRTVVCGVAEWCKKEDLKGKRVLCIVNVKKGDVKGVESAGRCLVATQGDKKAFCEPPAQAKVGEKIKFADAGNEPSDPAIAGKHFNDMLKILHTNAAGVVQLGDVAFETSAGPATAPLKDATVA